MKRTTKILLLLLMLSQWANAQLTDRIVSISGPEQVFPGFLSTVSISYEASTTRKLVVLLQENSPPWAGYGQTSIIVSAGTGTAELSISLDRATPFKKNSYKFVAYITEENGWWGEKFSSMDQNNVSYVAEPHPTKTDSFASPIENLSAEKKEEKIEHATLWSNDFPIDTSEPSDKKTNKNLIENGTFSKGKLNWHLLPFGASTGALSTNNRQELFCDVTFDDGTNWHLNAQQSNFQLKNGQEYRLQYRARAEKSARTLRALIKVSGGQNVHMKDITLSTQMTTYNTLFVMNQPTADCCELSFYFGGAGDNGIFLDDISLIEVETDMILGGTIPPSKSLLFSLASYRQPKHIYKNHIVKREK